MRCSASWARLLHDDLGQVAKGRNRRRVVLPRLPSEALASLLGASDQMTDQLGWNWAPGRMVLWQSLAPGLMVLWSYDKSGPWSYGKAYRTAIANTSP